MRAFETGNTTYISFGRLQLVAIVLLISITSISFAQQPFSRPDQKIKAGSQMRVAAVCDDGFVSVGWNGTC